MATLSSLVAETTAIKNTLTSCHSSLKTNLTKKGVSISNSDTISTMINKINTIPQSDNTYHLQVNIFMQTSTPTGKNIGDIWISTSKKLNPILSVAAPSSPKANDCWIGLSSLICDITLDKSMRVPLAITYDKKFTIDLMSNKITTKQDQFTLFKSSTSTVYGKYISCKTFNGSTWVNENGVRYWNGSQWVHLSPSTLYAIKDGVVNTDVFGDYHSNISNYMYETYYLGVDCLQIRAQDSYGYGRISFTFGKKVDLSAYSSVIMTFTFSADDIEGNFALIESPTQHFGQTSAAPSSVTKKHLWDGYTFSSPYTSVKYTGAFSSNAHFGLNIYAYDPVYLYVKDLYFIKPEKSYDLSPLGEKVPPSEEQIKESELMIESGNKLKRIYYMSLGLEESTIDELIEKKIDVHQVFKIENGKAIQELEVNTK